MRIVTHNGHFHTDDLLAVAALLLKYPDAEVVRTRDEEIIATADIAVDVGHIYDPSKLRFDHHMTEGAGKRENGIPYASFGLVWKEFGAELAGGVEEAKIIEDKLVIPVDAGDSGVSIWTPLVENIVPYTIWNYFDSFSGDVKTQEDFDDRFMRALEHARDLIKREIFAAKKSVENLEEVKRIYNESENKKIIILPENMHYKRALIPTEAIYVIRPRADGQWSVRAIPRMIHGFELKKPFPSSWAGLRDKEMEEVSGVPDATFCHRDRWLSGAKTKEGAIKLAEIALNS